MTRGNPFPLLADGADRTRLPTRPAATFSRSVAVLAFTVGSAFLLAGCTSPRNALGTPDGRCFKVLPEARLAVHGQGRFSGVRYLTLASFTRALRAAYPQLSDVPARVSHGVTTACIVAYSGHFDDADVARAWRPGTGTGAGRLALVILRPSDATLLATVVLPHAPLDLTRIDALDP